MTVAGYTQAYKTSKEMNDIIRCWGSKTEKETVTREKREKAPNSQWGYAVCVVGMARQIITGWTFFRGEARHTQDVVTVRYWWVDGWMGGKYGSQVGLAT